MVQPKVVFPHPDFATEDGIVALGGNLDVETLVTAYSKGIFPWPIPGIPLPWFSPDPRAVLLFDSLQVSSSLKKLIRSGRFHATHDQAFDQVIRGCAEQPRKGQDGETWLTDEMIRGYSALHQAGHAHSFEVWNDANQLVGGVYGVSVGGCFSAESMFFKESNASKVALVHLINHLQARGLDWIDIQQLTPHLENLGAKTISRRNFLNQLAETQALNLRLFPAEQD